MPLQLNEGLCPVVPYGKWFAQFSDAGRRRGGLAGDNISPPGEGRRLRSFQRFVLYRWHQTAVEPSAGGIAG